MAGSDGHSGERWVQVGVASPVLPALAHTWNLPRRGMGGKPGRSGSSRSYCHTLDAAGGFRGGVAGAEPPHKGGPNRPDRTTAVVGGQWLVKAAIEEGQVRRGVEITSLA